MEWGILTTTVAHKTIFLVVQMGKMGSSPLAGLAALGLGGLNPGAPGGINPAGEKRARNGQPWCDVSSITWASLYCYLLFCVCSTALHYFL